MRLAVFTGDMLSALEGTTGMVVRLDLCVWSEQNTRPSGLLGQSKQVGPWLNGDPRTKRWPLSFQTDRSHGDSLASSGSQRGKICSTRQSKPYLVLTVKQVDVGCLSTTTGSPNLFVVAPEARPISIRYPIGSELKVLLVRLVSPKPAHHNKHTYTSVW